MSQANNAMVIIDVKKSTIEKFLEELDMGEGSIVGFVTENGREIIIEKLAEGESSKFEKNEIVFFNEEFYQEVAQSEQLSGSAEVKFRGQDYVFIYSRSDVNKATICVLVPNELVIGQAQEIGDITIKLVILAVIIAVLIGIAITSGIQKSLKRVSKVLEQVADGNLTGEVVVKSKDEFRDLADSTTDMIYNNKNLVRKVTDATGQLEN